MPKVPARQDFNHKVRAKAYPTAERNGLIWVYMGQRMQPPCPARHRGHPDCPQHPLVPATRGKWLQAPEGDIDTSHLGVLHLGSLGAGDLPAGHSMRPTVQNRAPEYVVMDAPWGTMHGGHRPGEEGLTSWRVAHYPLPFWAQTPNTQFATRALACAWVPMDDANCMLFDIAGGVDAGNPAYNSKRLSGEPLFEPFVYAPNSSDRHGRWRCVDNVSNDWGVDRGAQRSGRRFTGIANATMQDQAVTESMGGITSHEFEHLGPSDLMITRTRKRALAAARAWNHGAGAPPGVDDPEVCYGARAGSFMHDPAVNLQAAYRAQWADAVRLRSVALSCQVFGEHLRAQGSGHIINITSLPRQKGGTVASAHYAAAKAGALMLSKYFAQALAGSGVPVNAIAPGFISTAKGRSSAEQIAAIEQRLPIGRFGESEETAAAVLLLAGDQGGFSSVPRWT